MHSRLVGRPAYPARLSAAELRQKLFLNEPRVKRADALSTCRLAGLSASLRHFLEAFGDELIDAFSRLCGLFRDAAMKLRGNAQ
jgi:hypothetical protein